MIQKQEVQQKQKLLLSQFQRQSLAILALDSLRLNEFIQDALANNPVLKMDHNSSFYMEDTVSFENYTASNNDIISDLISQFHIASPDTTTSKIGEYLICSLDKHGYLDCSINETAHYLKVCNKQVKSALKILQSLEPAGVGARDLKESLYLQLMRRENPNPLALEVVQNFFGPLANREYESIAEALAVAVEDIKKAAGAIRTLNPYPLRREESNAVQYITPELVVYIKDGEPVVAPIHKSPSLSFVKEGIQEYLAEAKQIIAAIAKRQQTLLKIGKYIADVQRDFFLNVAAPCALTQETAAGALGLSSSTISRAVNGKYLQFNNKTYPINYFFPPHITAGGSREQIKAIIRSVISGESPSKPVSDGKIALYITSLGQPIIKRTITKYRQEMNIPPFSERYISLK